MKYSLFTSSPLYEREYILQQTYDIIAMKKTVLIGNTSYDLVIFLVENF